MTNLMFLLLYCIGVAVLFRLACALEKLALWWHETHRRSKEPPYHMRDYRRSKEEKP